ncbi:MAG: hypothetical protein RLZZ408_145 [Verrucomicrobiota bacterium]|jgi:hypothetical protein
MAGITTYLPPIWINLTALNARDYFWHNVEVAREAGEKKP